MNRLHSRPRGPALAALARTADYWMLSYDGRTHALRARRGLVYLARLLAEPERELHALELSGSHFGAPPGEALLAPLDATARAAYRARMDALREAADYAEATGNDARAAQARVELDVIARELAHALGLGGRNRNAPTAADRARAAVTLAIRRGIEVIRQVEPVLGGHFDTAVRTGLFCSYCPDPCAGLSWRIVA
jgi:hypothetical protein